MNIGGIIFGDNITPGHAISTKMASGSSARRARQRRLAYMNHLDAELCRPALYQYIAALQRHWWQEDAVWQVFEVIEIPADTNLAFNLVVIRRKISYSR